MVDICNPNINPAGWFAPFVSSDSPECQPFNCAALMDYITALPGAWNYGVFADNKGVPPYLGTSVGFDESGQSHHWHLEGSVSTQVRWYAESDTPGACDEALTYMRVENSIYHPIEIVPAADTNWPKATITVGAVLRHYADNGQASPLLSIGRFRSGSSAWFMNSDGTTYVIGSESGGIHSSSLVVPLDEWFYAEMTLDTITGDYVIRLNEDEEFGNVGHTYGNYFAGVWGSITNYNDVGYNVRWDYRVGWVIEGAGAGAAGYQEFLKTTIGYTIPECCLESPNAWGSPSDLGCLGYECDAMLSRLISDGWQYIWPMNDKHGPYAGVIDEINGSIALIATGSVSNQGQDVPAMDSCIGVTGWRIREEDAVANTSLLLLDNDESQELIDSGFTFTSAMLKNGAATIDTQSGSILYGDWRYESGGQNRGVSFRFRIQSSTELELLTQGDVLPTISTVLTLPFTIVSGTKYLITLSFTRIETKVWINGIYIGNLVYATLPAPIVAYQHFQTNLTHFNNAEFIVQNTAMMPSLITDEQMVDLYKSYRRNFTDYIALPGDYRPYNDWVSLSDPYSE